MHIALNIIQIVLAIVLIMVVMFQVRGGGLGGIFGQADTVFRTRRGLERRLFQLTIILILAFVIIAIISLRASY